MRRFFRYLTAQLKRTAKGSIAVLLLCAILTVCLMCVTRAATDEAAKKKAAFDLEIGIVGDMENTFLKMGVYALQNLDASSVYVKFTTMDESTAMERLEKREIIGYVFVPESFVEDVMSYKNTPVTFVTLANPTSLAPKLVNRMVEIVSTYITECQCGVYGNEEYARELGTYVDYSKLDTLNIEYITFLITRDSAFDINVISSPDELSDTAYYVCAIGTLMIMLIGITASPVFAARKMSLPRLLRSGGLGSGAQIAAEYISFTLLLFFCTFMMTAGLGTYIIAAEINVEGLALAGMNDVLGFAFKLFPVCMTVAAMQMLLFELTDSLLNAVILQFVCAVSLGYISGCFYPSYFFPESVQALAAVLPVGSAMNYAGSFFLPSHGSIVLPLVWTAVFLILTAVARGANMKGGRE